MVLLAGLALPAAEAEAQQQGHPVLVEKVYGKPVVHELQGDGFVSTGQVLEPGALEGVEVVEVSSKGYAALALPTGTVWVDRLNLRFNTTVPKAYCGRLGKDSHVSASGDATSPVVRGAGEGCR